MNLTDYERVADALLAKAKEIENSKRPSYTIGDEDVLRNFKRDAAMAGITPHQNWLTHFLKQTAAIARWARTPDDQQSEPIEQRLADVVNYCRLGVALAAESAPSDGQRIMVVSDYCPEPEESLWYCSCGQLQEAEALRCAGCCMNNPNRTR